MGTWRWWWTGVLLVGTGLNCGKSKSDGNEPQGEAGHSSAGAPSPIDGGGSSFEGDETAGAGGERLAVGGSGGDVEPFGGAGGLSTGEGGRADDVVITDDMIADDAVVITKDCTDELGEASIELTRYCLLLISCSPYGADPSFGDCVWHQDEFVANAPCASKVTTCAELGECGTTRPDNPPWDALRECVDDVLHITVDGNTSEVDCAARGLRCLDVFDPHGDEYNATCVPDGCDVDHAEPWGNSCEGDDLVGNTSATKGGDDRPATVTVHCPDFGFATCRDDRCVP